MKVKHNFRTGRVDILRCYVKSYFIEQNSDKWACVERNSIQPQKAHLSSRAISCDTIRVVMRISFRVILRTRFGLTEEETNQNLIHIFAILRVLMNITNLHNSHALDIRDRIRPRFQNWWMLTFQQLHKHFTFLSAMHSTCYRESLHTNRHYSWFETS
jgi:hypothetical protein